MLVKNMLISSRPISWPNTAVPFLLAYVFASNKTGTFSMSMMILGVIFFTFPYNFLLYGINDVYDYQTDLNNPRKGGIEGSILPMSLHSKIKFWSIFLCIPFIVYFGFFGNYLAFFLLLLVMFDVLIYSVPPLRTKEKPIWDSFTSSLHFVGPAIFGFQLGDGEYTKNYFIIIFAFVFWGMASHAFGAIQDIIFDRKANINSIATFFGAKFTVRFSLLFYFLVCILILFLPGYYKFIIILFLPYIFIVKNYLKITDSDSFLTNRGWGKFIYLNYVVGFLITQIFIINLVSF